MIHTSFRDLHCPGIIIAAATLTQVLIFQIIDVEFFLTSQYLLILLNLFLSLVSIYLLQISLHVSSRFFVPVGLDIPMNSVTFRKERLHSSPSCLSSGKTHPPGSYRSFFLWHFRFLRYTKFIQPMFGLHLFLTVFIWHKMHMLTWRLNFCKEYIMLFIIFIRRSSITIKHVLHWCGTEIKFVRGNKAMLRCPDIVKNNSRSDIVIITHTSCRLTVAKIFFKFSLIELID